MNAHFKLEKHQQDALNKLVPIIKKNNVAYLVGEVRTGKTLVSLHLSQKFGARPKVLFLTVKKAIQSIKSDYESSGLKLDLRIFNFEKLHKIDFNPEFIIIDEAHKIGRFPKPSKTAKQIKEKFNGIPTLLMSGTPSPESFSQLFHQFWITGNGPWTKYNKFYRWVKDYVNVKKVYIGMGQQVNNYSETKEKVTEEFDKFKVSMTQKQAGFKGKVIEKVHTVQISEQVKSILKSLRKTKMYYSDDFELVADTAGKLNSYFHQLTSGTVIDIEKKKHLIDNSKIKYIKREFKNKHIAIFYIFRQEGDILRKLFKNHTDDPHEFNTTDKVFICQIQSGSMGVNLSSADAVVFYNISYSAVQYWQARSRSLTKNSGNKTIHWIFSDTGFETEIYNTVNNKQDFTLKHFQNYARKFQTGKNQKVATENGSHSNQTQGVFRGRVARFN